jgi:hypothetical protein
MRLNTKLFKNIKRAVSKEEVWGTNNLLRKWDKTRTFFTSTHDFRYHLDTNYLEIFKKVGYTRERIGNFELKKPITNLEGWNE